MKISKTMTYDSRSYDLAEHFIGSAPEMERLRQLLAQHIQSSIEDWFGYEQTERALRHPD